MAIWRLGILEALRRSMAYLALLATYASRWDQLGGPVTHETMGNYGLMGFNGDYRGSMNQKTGMLVDIPFGYVKIAIENGDL